MKKFLVILSIGLNVYLLFLLSKKVNFEKHYEYYINGNKYVDKSNNPARALLFEAMPIEHNALVFAGDSHVEKFELTELLNKDFKNRGIEGDNIEGLISRLHSITVNKPRKIFLQIGLNDLAYGDTKETVLNNYKKLIGFIKKASPHSKIYINSIFPTEIGIMHNVTYCNQSINADIKMLNDSLSKFKGVYFIDCYKAFARNDQLKSELTSDGIHLNGAGYILWSELLKNYLR